LLYSNAKGGALSVLRGTNSFEFALRLHWICDAGFASLVFMICFQVSVGFVLWTG